MKRKLLVSLVVVIIVGLPTVHYVAPDVDSWSAYNVNYSNSVGDGETFFGCDESNVQHFCAHVQIDPMEMSSLYVEWVLVIDGTSVVNGTTNTWHTADPFIIPVSADYAGFTFGMHTFYFIITLKQDIYVVILTLGTKQTNVAIFNTYEFTNIDISIDLLDPQNHASFPYEQDSVIFSHTVSVTVNGGTDYEIRLGTYLNIDDGSYGHLESIETIGNSASVTWNGDVEISKYYGVGQHEIKIGTDSFKIEKDGGWFNPKKEFNTE